MNKVKVDFYILEAASGQKSLLFACQLIEKFYGEQKQVFVHTASREEAERFNTLLWTYRDDSFVPHQIYQENHDTPPPIQIGLGSGPAKAGDVLVNLSQQIPAYYQQFSHVIEIVFSDPHVQQLARERYKQYRDQGGDMNTIKLKAHEMG